MIPFRCLRMITGTYLRVVCLNTDESIEMNSTEINIYIYFRVILTTVKRSHKNTERL